MLTYIMISLIKICDNILLTAKSIATYKGKKLTSSILVAISQLLFYLVIEQVVNDSTMLAIILVSISSGIGNYIAFLINDKFSKDDTFTNILTTSDKDDAIKLCSILRKKKIKYLLFSTFNRQFEESLTIMVFAKTRAESKIIDNYLEFTEAKYLRMIDGIEVKTKE